MCNYHINYNLKHDHCVAYMLNYYEDEITLPQGHVLHPSDFILYFNFHL